ncbi:hypothetical protein F4775DRAFT_543094 [Biscogniauxia sp. FL1348]|nr:hypothetical protein F4775DRAFT_543094 [Biscogniauxia sp. FL1348]
MTAAAVAVAVAAGAPPPPPSADNPEYTRLHITPLDQSLLDIVIPSSVLPHARNISYHTVETFPEKRYGFVDLPITHAEKLKKKLNGAVLKGVKMRIEKARPESIPEPEPQSQPAADADEDDVKARKEKKNSKKRKREEGVIPGVELEDRRVKRGWTTSEQEMIEKKRKKSKESKESKIDKKPREETRDRKDKKDKKGKKDKKRQRDIKSKYTDAPECLFKTKLPDPVATTTPTTTTRSSKRALEDDDSDHKKKKRKSGREVVIHEFEKTVKYPSFLKSKDDKVNPEAVTFEDGVGWVDSKGDVVEPLVSNRRATRSAKAVSSKSKQAELPPVVDDDEDDETSSSGTSSDDEDVAEEDSDQEAESSDREPHKTGMTSPVRKLKVDTQATSSPTSAAKPESARPKSSGSMNSLTIKIPPVTPAADKVHPLEALYKRPKGDTDASNGAGQESKPFSFFNGDDDDHDDDIEEDGGAATAPATQQPPMTPYTKQDFEFRNIRSAAPTPDTAHPSRSFSFWSRQETVDEESEKDEDEEEEEDGGNGNGNDEAEEQDDDDDDDDDMTMDNTATPQDTPTRSNKHAPPVPVSDFQKHFWENRGELNRKWRKRRREASKEKRYRENRSRAARAI